VDLPATTDIRQVGLWGRSDVEEGDATFGTTVEVWVGSAPLDDSPGAITLEALTQGGATQCASVAFLNQAVDEEGASAAISDCGPSGATGSWVLVVARGTADALQTLAICELGIEPLWFSERLAMPGAAARDQSFDPGREYTCENQKPACELVLETLPNGVATPFDEVAILPSGSTCGVSKAFSKGFGVNPLPGVDLASGEELVFENLTYDADARLLVLPVLVGRPMTKDVETHVLCACLRPVESFKPFLGGPCSPEEFTTPIGTLRIKGSPYTWSSFATAASLAVVLFYVGL
jgi:hypothetical protein